MSVLTALIVSLYEMNAADIAALESALFEQLRLAWIEQIRALAIQHGAVNPTPQLQGAELERLQTKAREDAVSIAATYNRELASQVNAIYNRNPQAGRGEYIRVLDSWNRERGEHKAITIALSVIMWAAHYGLTVFVTRNNLQHQLYRAVGAAPKCPECMRIVAAGIVSFRYTQENPLPAHPNCVHDYVVINATDLRTLGLTIWAG